MFEANAMLPHLFHRGHLRELGLPTLLAAVVLLLSAIVLLGANVSQLRANSALVQQTDDILIQVSEVDAKLVGVEMTVRGYALTDDPIFLRYQNYERKHIALSMDQLAALVAGEATQVGLFAQLRPLIARRLALYASLTDLGPGHAKDVADAITDHVKRTDMENARLTLAAMRDQEIKLLADRQAAATAQASRTYTQAIGIVVLAFVVGGLGCVFLLYGRAADTPVRGSKH